MFFEVPVGGVNNCQILGQDAGWMKTKNINQIVFLYVFYQVSWKFVWEGIYIAFLKTTIIQVIQFYYFPLRFKKQNAFENIWNFYYIFRSYYGSL